MKSLKRAVLVVSYGVRDKESREKSIGGIEAAVKNELCGYKFFAAFTSGFIIERIYKAEGVLINGAEQMLNQLCNSGFDEVIIQPTHILNGVEYQKVADLAKRYSKKLSSLRLGLPLLFSDDDIKAVAQIIADRICVVSEDKTAFCLIGHGSESEADCVYQKLQSAVSVLKRSDIFITTLPQKNESIIEKIKAFGAENVILVPLMITAGAHAKNNIAANENSWRSFFKSEGFDVRCDMRGLGEYNEIQKIFAEHAANSQKV